MSEVSDIRAAMQAKDEARRRKVLDSFRDLGARILPPGSRLWLYGSQARGEATADSDWDLLIIVDKAKRELYDDFDRWGYPFVDLGIDWGESVSAIIYTRVEWEHSSFTPFHKNVERDKIELL